VLGTLLGDTVGVRDGDADGVADGAAIALHRPQAIGQRVNTRLLSQFCAFLWQ
jgi:hypothetical protein